MKIHFGCGKSKKPGYIGVDLAQLPGVDIIHNLNVFPYPFKTNEADDLLLENILEHLPNTIAVMEELWRISRNSGTLHISVPYYNSQGAHTDPTHVRFFSEHSFDYFAPDGENFLSFYNFYSKARFNILSITPIQNHFLFLFPKRLQWFFAHHFATVHGLHVILQTVK